MVLSGISSSFPELSQSERQIIYVLLTRAPLTFFYIATKEDSFDLHVLGTPPALVLSQNQTLHKNYYFSIARVNYFMKRLTFFKIKRYFSQFLDRLVINRYHRLAFGFAMTRLASYSKSFDLILK